MKIKYIIYLIFILYCPLVLGGGYEYEHLPDFKVPKAFFSDHNYHPVGYLSSYPIIDINKSLKNEEKIKLAKLFIAASEACREKYHQDYNIETSCPIYLLLKTNFPKIISIETEGGNIVFLNKIEKFLKLGMEDEV